MPGGRRQPIARALRELGNAQIRDRSLTPDEALERVHRQHPDRISRRDALKIGAAAAGGLVLAACSPARSSAPPTPASATVPQASATASEARIVVVGAGLAGTTAAYRLSKAGLNVQVYEARDRIGGRCWTKRDWPHGQQSEHGGEFIDTRHIHIRQLAKELGLEEEDLWSGWHAGDTWLTFLNGKVGQWSDWADDQKPLVKVVNAKAKEIGLIGPGENGDVHLEAIWAGNPTPEAVAFDQLSMTEFMEQEIPGLADSAYGVFLDTVMAGWYGLNMASLSAMNWMDYFVLPANGADERWHIKDGNDQIPVLAADQLPDGSLHLEAPLESVRATGDTYELRFGGIADPVVADFVIMTAPFIVLRDTELEGLSQAKMDQIRVLSMGTDVKLFLQYGFRPERFTAPDGGQWSGGLEQADAGFETWESTEVQPGPTSVLTVYAGGQGSARFAAPDYHALPPDSMVQETLELIDDAVPGTKDAYAGSAWLDYWTGDPWTRGSYAAFTPGQYTSFWGATAQPDGNHHFAGEHTSTDSQGYLNGGVESGQRAAIEVMQKLGVEVPAAIADMTY